MSDTSKKYEIPREYTSGNDGVRYHPEELWEVYEKTLFTTWNSQVRHVKFPCYVRINGTWYHWESCRSGWYMRLAQMYGSDLLELIDRQEEALQVCKKESESYNPAVDSPGVTMNKIITASRTGLNAAQDIQRDKRDKQRW